MKNLLIRKFTPKTTQKNFSNFKSNTAFKLLKLNFDIMKELLKEAIKLRGVLGNRKVIFVECSTAGFITWIFSVKPGASQNLAGCLSPYSNDLKSWLGADLSDGAVSEKCVRSLAESVAQKFDVDFVVVESSVLGPTHHERPKGLSWIAIFCKKEKKVFTWVDLFSGGRENVRQNVAKMCFNLLRLHIEGESFETYNVSSTFAEYKGKVLLMKRSRKVRTYKGFWGVASGYVEKDETPPQTALKELYEETGITKDKVEKLVQASPLEVVDSKIKIRWIVHPFRAILKEKPKVKLDWEHTDFKWLPPQKIKVLKTSPLLWVGYLKTVWGEVENIDVAQMQ